VATSYQRPAFDTLTTMRQIADKDRPWPGQAPALHRGISRPEALASSHGAKWAPSGIFKVLISSTPVVL
jgi:hypothetical protein